MNKTTKGALAAGAAGVLLLGGVGTLAFWTDTETADGTGIDSGHLKLAAARLWCRAGFSMARPPRSCRPPISWSPGDTLTKVCDYTVDAAGEHLAATFTATGPLGHHRCGRTRGRDQLRR